MQINNPSGTPVEVSELGQLLVDAAVKSAISAYASIGRAFSWASTKHDILINETVLLIKNTYDNKHLIIDKIITAGESASFFVHLPYVATFSGTAITGVSLDSDWNSDDNADVYQHETGNTEGSVIIRSTAPGILDIGGAIRIGSGKCIAVDYETEANNSSVTILGHFE